MLHLSKQSSPCDLLCPQMCMNIYVYLYTFCIYKRYFSPLSTNASLWAWTLCYFTLCLIIANFPSFSPLSVSKQSSPCDLLCPQISRFMGPTWGPSGAERTQVGPMLAPWTLLSRSLSPWPNYFHFSFVLPDSSKMLRNTSLVNLNAVFEFYLIIALNNLLQFLQSLFRLLPSVAPLRGPECRLPRSLPRHPPVQLPHQEMDPSNRSGDHVQGHILSTWVITRWPLGDAAVIWNWIINFQTHKW